MNQMITELDAAWLRLFGLLASPRGERNGKECFGDRRAVFRALFELEDKRRQVGLPPLDQLAPQTEQIRWN